MAEDNLSNQTIGMIKKFIHIVLVIFLSKNYDVIAQSNLNDATIIESVFVHTDRNIYIVGETMWLSAFCRDLTSGNMSTLSKVLNVELIDSNGKSVIQKRLKLSEGIGSGQFFLSAQLPTGKFTLLAYTSWMKNFDSKMVFQKEITIVNPSITPLYEQSNTAFNKPNDTIEFNGLNKSNFEIKKEKDQYMSREKVTISFASNTDDLIQYSVSVHKFDSSFSEQVDITKPILPDLPNSTSFPPEAHAPIVSGQVISHNPDSSQSIKVIFLGKASFMNSADLNRDGIFHFEVPFRILNESVYLLNDNEISEPPTIQVNSPFGIKTNSSSTPLSLNLTMRPYLESLNRNIQIAQVYRTHTHINGIPTQPKQVENHFYGKPDYVYHLDDYTRFRSVKDLFIEYIKEADVRKKQGKEGFYITEGFQQVDKALTMLDGIPVLDATFILELDPLKIEKIGIVTSQYHMGSIHYNGIINFTTYKGDFDNKELPNYIIKKQYHPIQQKRFFFSPDYSNSQNKLEKIPDFRSTLYWYPIDNKSNSTESHTFFTGDDQGMYQIEVIGVSSNGDLSYQSSLIEVIDQ